MTKDYEEESDGIILSFDEEGKGPKLISKNISAAPIVCILKKGKRKAWPVRALR